MNMEHKSFKTSEKKQSLLERAPQTYQSILTINSDCVDGSFEDENDNEFGLDHG